MENFQPNEIGNTYKSFHLTNCKVVNAAEMVIKNEKPKRSFFISFYT